MAEFDTPQRPSKESGDGRPAKSPDIVEQDHPDHLDNIVPSKGYAMLPVVGLGGSAGSIPALQKFFAAMPLDTGMAFVVILHLAPEHVSVLDTILANATKLKVVQPADGQKIEADTVYVIPPGKFLTTDGERLKVTPFAAEKGRRVAVDIFFRTLADTHGPHATAIILSGADGDGALGLKRVKERGGLTITQEPSEAEHTGMPQTAIDTGMVDWILPVEQMPARLLQYRANESRLRLPSEDGPEIVKAAATPDSDEAALREILTFLRIRTGRDFSCYKRATIVRRISRRMQVNGAATLGEYLSILRTQPGETGALQEDLLISVTNFFRDREAFSALEAKIPELFAGKTATDVVRVWSAACATGEEAFSMGILLLEYAATLESPPAIQIFATDLAEDVITFARGALYPSTIQADVSEERLRRFFAKEQHGYRVRRELRECVLFAVHDILKDAPFSRMDLISCRNLLIYLNASAQKRVLEVMHFALRPRCLLFLGSSETVEEESSLWVPIDKKNRIFRQNPSMKIGLPVPLGPETIARAVEAQENAPGGLATHGRSFALRASMAVQTSLTSDAPRFSWEELHFKLIERFSPPSIIVTRDYDIVHVSQSAGRLLHFSIGEPSLNLLAVVNPMLRIELRAALFRAAQVNSPVEKYNVPVELDGRTQAVDIRVCPAQEIAPDYLLVVLDLHDPDGAQIPSVTSSDEPAVRHLERENEQLKRRLRDVIEQYEASGEELKAGNEELQAMNEELRSSAEELETSREELQSINEELSTVNHELKSKVDELGKANSDFSNLMAATGVATIFLDRALKITRYTPQMVALFNLIETDIGRPLNHITHHLDYPELEQDAKAVLSSLVPINREVSNGAQWFLVQLLPYRTPEDHILGVVFSFVDITEIRMTQQALKESNERLRLVFENAREFAIFSLDLDRRVVSWNAGAERLLGYTEAEIIGKTADIIFTPEDRAANVPEMESVTAIREGRASDERWHLREDGNRFWGSGSMMSMHDSRGKVIGLVKVFSDETQKRSAQQALEKSQAELRAALEANVQARSAAEAATRAKDQFMAVLSHELRTPITPVLMGLHLLERREDLAEPAREIVSRLKRNVEIEARLINDLLDVSRITHGKLDVVFKPVELHELVRHAIAVVESDFAEKRQKLELRLDATKTAASGDAGRLQQVFWNLLRNASKFTPEGGSVRVVTKNEGDVFVAEISDTGLGFSPEISEAIFNAFSQGGKGITESRGGLGLGLAIARAVVSAHSGEIRAASDGDGKGATFTVRLPLGGEPAPIE